MSSVHRFGRPGDRCRMYQKSSIGNQPHNSNRGGLSTQRKQRRGGQCEEHCWNSTMNRQFEDHRFRSRASSRYRCSQRSSESWRGCEVKAMTMSDRSRRNGFQDYAGRVESMSRRANFSRFPRPRGSLSTTRERNRKRRSVEAGWTRNSRSTSRERFLKLRRYWSKSRSRSSSAHRSVDDHSPRFSSKVIHFDFQESQKMVNFQRSVSKGPEPQSEPPPSQRSPAKSFKSSQSPAEIRVTNLTSNVTKRHLIEIFSRCGRVKNVEFDRHRGGESRAFIEFYNKADAEYAMSTMNEGDIDGKLIEVTRLRGSSRERPASPRIIFRHRTPPPMPHAMMIKTGRLLNQRRFVDPMRDKVETMPWDFNRKRQY